MSTERREVNQKRGRKGSEYEEWVATRKEKGVSLAGTQTSKRLTACGKMQTANQSQEPGQPENVGPKSPRARRFYDPSYTGRVSEPRTMLRRHG